MNTSPPADDPPMRFECSTCSAIHQDQLFSLDRCFERLSYGRPGQAPSAELASDESVAGYCSWACRALDEAHQMQALGYALPAVPPGCGPVEVCAQCQGLVDMAAWHLAVNQTELDFVGSTVQQANGRSLAVYCQACGGLPAAQAEEAPFRSDAERARPLG